MSGKKDIRQTYLKELQHQQDAYCRAYNSSYQTLPNQTSEQMHQTQVRELLEIVGSDLIGW